MFYNGFRRHGNNQGSGSQFSALLYKYLNKNHIEMVFISFDQDKDDNNWKSVLRHYQLSGNHIKANMLLKDDITLTIWGAKDVMSIPHYLLYNSDGILLDKQMPEPSNMPGLIQSISDKINKKPD